MGKFRSGRDLPDPVRARARRDSLAVRVVPEQEMGPARAESANCIRESCPSRACNSDAEMSEMEAGPRIRQHGTLISATPEVEI